VNNEYEKAWEMVVVVDGGNVSDFTWNKSRKL
jgi:hypothetical protein